MARFRSITLFALTLYLLSPLTGCQRPSPTNASGVSFIDVATQAGVARIYSTHFKPNIPLSILETIGHGGAFLDYNNDGNLDILLVDVHLALYEGDGRGHFTDVTHAVGLDKLTGHFLGCTVGDYDNDGYEDIYISGYHTGLLLHNEAAGITLKKDRAKDHTPRSTSKFRRSKASERVFRDVTVQAGLRPQAWGSSCGFVDLDGDGLLDLVIANYVEFGPDPKKYVQLCEPLACSPQSYKPERPTFYRNLGHGRFRDETAVSGMAASNGNGLGVAFADYDNDGRQDVLFANDETPGDLFQNKGGGRLDNVGTSAGVAFGPEGRVHGGMGADWADYDGDGNLDVIVTTYANQPKSLYRNGGNGIFTDVSKVTGIGNITAPYVAFGVKWLDYDNDGWPDLLIANGNVDNNISIILPDHHYRETPQLLRNMGATAHGGQVTFTDVSKQVGIALQRPIVGRGLAIGDFNNDGRIDALIIENDGPVMLLQNTGGKIGNWIGLTLIGTGRSNRDAIGARVTVQAGGHSQVREVQTSGSYLSASDRRLLFGIGTATHVDKVTLRWPDGQTEDLAPPAINTYHTVREHAHPGR